MPYHKLVTFLRQGLKFLYKTATEHERRWLKEALLSQPLPRPCLKFKQTEYQQTQPTAVKPDILEARLLSGLVIIRERLRKRYTLQCSDPSSSPGSAYAVVKKPQKSGPNGVRRVESPTAELWKSQLLSGLAIMQENRSSKRSLSDIRTS